MQVVGEVTDAIDALLQMASTHADIVLIDLATKGEDPGLCSHILAEYPNVKVIALSTDGKQVVVYRKGIVRRQMPEMSPHRIRDLLRSLIVEEDPIGNDLG